MLDKTQNNSFYRDVVAGLSLPQKALPPKYFYDERGSQLFEAICELPEYYPTRTEAALLSRIAPELAAALHGYDHLIEYGSGASKKTRIVLDALTSLNTYVPMDISEEFLLGVAEILNADYPHLDVVPLVGDFTSDVVLPREVRHGKKIGFFPGSTIGNLGPEGGREFLRQARRTLGDDAAFLLGADLVKDEDVLRTAYNDRAGVTADFNLNLLARINRELGANFDARAFHHTAIWNRLESRIEMHLVSDEAQSVSVNGNVFRFRKGETIHTENSYKFTPDRIEELSQASGWSVRTLWADEAFPFAVALLDAR
ncbi:MAG TPA: L-histidine N(alpha)-methyltransferase [Xanthobacteraceae bacterium]|nr:L-histidine N(alpha)-methyltransferase [Xanthobacteraceae bacterium]